ncbi:MAG: hypothetical protein A2234_03480 [Elusimicrobia bacterium RIFOXYA2_FULL_58_8]|nr:MAG: hypothetical protein A2285_05155 [Elusimicrobia bacterium RIFOXYA12_FULL_57_11]OGS17186.1 MAG: hypothetical protein A2234_03480 [Elusimicrobia bacterium RIFOXYA2_FULL_58_8]
MNILIVHGPNLHLLGTREPELYGSTTLKQLDARLKARAAGLNARLRCFQSNCEGEIIDIMTANAGWAHALIINPAAYTHYSYAIRDAIKALGLKAVEVHLTDILKRETFRKTSVIRPVCATQFKGEGTVSYMKALEYCVKNFKDN